MTEFEIIFMVKTKELTNVLGVKYEGKKRLKALGVKTEQIMEQFTKMQKEW